MPTYEYACSSCGKEFEFFQSMKDAPLTKCVTCGSEGTVKRKIGGGAGIIFKGGGFYETDYKRKSGGASDSGGKSEGSSNAGSSGGASSAPSPSTGNSSTSGGTSSATPAAKPSS